MLAFYFLILLPYVCQGCPWPLKATTHDYVAESFNISNMIIHCSMGCGIEPAPAIWFKLDQQEWIDMLCSVLAIIGLVITLWVCINLWLQHKDRSTNLCREDLSYQIPFIINLGYMIFLGTLLFHQGSILIHSDSPSYCNRDEETMSIGDPANGNVSCTILSLIVFIIIKLEMSYTTLLSIVLFHLLWFPLYRIRNYKLIAHSVIWLIIIFTTSCVIWLNSMQAVLSMRTCLPTLQNPEATLWLEIIPFVLFQSVGTVLLFLCLYKLWRMWVARPEKMEIESRDRSFITDDIGSQSISFVAGRKFPSFSISRINTRISRISFAVKNSPRAKQLRDLSVRLLVFNVVQSTFVGLLCFNLIYWYNQHDQWESSSKNVVFCQIERYGYPMWMGMQDTDGARLESAYNCIDSHGQDGPPAWAVWIFYVIVVGGTLAGCILTCSNETVKKYKRAYVSTRDIFGLKSTRNSYNSQLPIATFETPVETTTEMVTIERTSYTPKASKSILLDDLIAEPDNRLSYGSKVAREHSSPTIYLKAV